MNILVLGNGFDLAHGLPTKYGDFLEFVQAFSNFKSSVNSQNKYSVFFTDLEETKSDVFEELDKLISNNCWLEYFIRIYKSRMSEGKEGWIDFECEISTVIQALDSARHTLNEQFRKGDDSAHMEQWQWKVLQPVFFSDKSGAHSFSQVSVDRLKNKLIQDLNRLTRCLEMYLCTYLSIGSCQPLKDIAKLKVDKVLSFNYTDTYKILYDKAKVEYDYIHGKARATNTIDSCNLVLGIDEYLSDDKRNSDNEFIQFKKFFQRIYKGTGCHYIDWLNDRRDTINRTPNPELNIYIYGHSLDVTDADILRKLIMENGAQTTIFYHNKKTLGNQIANLVKVIGEEELIKRTDGKKRTIVFQQTSTDKA